MEGTVLSGIGGTYVVLGNNGEKYALRAQNKIRYQRMKPLVGDRVRFLSSEGDQDGWLESVLPRRNSLIRPPVANIDRLAIVLAAGTPQADLLLADRMLIFARMNGIEPLLVINKCDQNVYTSQDIALQYAHAQVEIYTVSAKSGEGIETLFRALKGTVHAFGGQSGVGKSTLINCLYGLSREVGNLSEKIERGKNTTRCCELIPIEGGGMVLDTPGFSYLELELMDPVNLREWMPEFAPYEGRCRFSPCIHVSEPGCAVRAAVEAGELSQKRWERYKALYGNLYRRWKERYD